MCLQSNDQSSVLCARDSDRPPTLIFAITTLDFFVRPLLYLSLEDSRPRGFVKFSNFQDVRSIDPVVGPSAHDMVLFAFELIDGDLHFMSISVALQVVMKASYVAVCRGIYPARVDSHGEKSLSDSLRGCAGAEGRAVVGAAPMSVRSIVRMRYRLT